MMKSEKLKARVIESTLPPPHEDMSLADRPDEIWKPFPVEPFDDIFVISNKGRVKRLAYTMINKNNMETRLPERIRKLSANKEKSYSLNKTTYYLVCIVSKNKFTKAYPVARLVYSAFVAPLDIYDQTVFVRYKDENSLNCVPENLYLFDRSKITRWLLDHGRRTMIEGISDPERLSKEYRQTLHTNLKRRVCQYDLEGNYIRTFNSRKEAAEAVGLLNPTAISAVITGKVLTAANFIWRNWTENPEPRTELRKTKLYIQKLAQYDMNGNLVCIFDSKNKAAAALNLSASTISDRLCNRSPQKDFILVEVKEEEPAAKITVELPPERVYNNKKNGIPEGQKYPFQNLSLDDLPGEEWKEMPHTDQIYWVSNLGRVKSVDYMMKTTQCSYLKRGQMITQAVKHLSKNGPPVMCFSISIRKRVSNHQTARLVYTLFKGEIPPKYVIAYKDNDPLNCKIENLILKTFSDNIKQFYQEGKLSNPNKKEVAQYTPQGELIAIYPSTIEAGRKTGFPATQISVCASGKSKRKLYHGFIWKYTQHEQKNLSEENK